MHVVLYFSVVIFEHLLLLIELVYLLLHGFDEIVCWKFSQDLLYHVLVRV